MEKITKIQISNSSKWTISDCIQHCSGVNIAISPICKAFPEDILFFYIYNAE